MQRKATKNTRGPNAGEKRFLAWVKDQPCSICSAAGPSIVDHMYGSAFKHNKVLIGMWALLPYCQQCDAVKTIQGRARHDQTFGKPQAMLFYTQLTCFVPEALQPPDDVINAILDWGR